MQQGHTYIASNQQFSNWTLHVLTKREIILGTENQLGIQIPRCSKVMNLGAEPTISTLLNQHNTKQQHKYLSLYPQITEVSCLIKEPCLCNRWRSLPKTTTNQNPESWSPFHLQYSSAPKSHESLRKWGVEEKNCESRKIGGVALVKYLIVKSEGTPIISPT